MSKEEKIDFLISCAEDLENDHNLEIWGTENLQECADAFRDGAEALRESKTGKWIIEEIGIRSYATKCSECGTILHEGHNFDNAQQYTEYVNRLGQYDKFCHECGTKMEGEE